MKTGKIISVLIFLSFVVIFSCTKEEDKPQPNASFTASKTTVFIGEEITFTNTSTNSTSYIWSFGDGTTSTEASPIKSYTSAGAFTVTLVAKGEGGKASFTLDITTEEEEVPPTASFTASNSSVAVGEEIQFTNTSKNATSYSWDFGDGTFSTETSPIKAYDEAGTYVVTLTATSEVGSDTETLEITVISPSSASIYFIDVSDELIQQLILDGTGTLVTVKDVAGMSGVGLVYDEVNSKIFFSDFVDYTTPDGKIWKMNLDGTGAEAIVTGILDPYGIALDLVDNKVYWTDDNGNISRSNLDGTSPEIGIVNVVDGGMRAIALDKANDKMYFYEVQLENLYVANLDGTNATILISGVYGYSIFIDTVNDKIYFDDQNTPGLRRANLDGTNIEAIDATDTRIYGIDIDYDENKLYWSGRDSGEIYKADLDGTNKETLVTGLSSPRGIFLKK